MTLSVFPFSSNPTFSHHLLFPMHIYSSPMRLLPVPLLWEDHFSFCIHCILNLIFWLYSLTKPFNFLLYCNYSRLTILISTNRRENSRRKLFLSSACYFWYPECCPGHVRCSTNFCERMCNCFISFLAQEVVIILGNIKTSFFLKKTMEL